MTLYARLDKTGLRILCGVLDCRGELARVEVIGRPDDGGGPVKRRAFFGPGWVYREAEGVWELSKYARRRVRGGNQPKHTHVPKSVLRSAGEGTRRDIVVGWTTYGTHEARCPRCGSRQTLAPSRLQLTEKVPELSPGVPLRTAPYTGTKVLPCGYRNHEHTDECVERLLRTT